MGSHMASAQRPATLRTFDLMGVRVRVESARPELLSLLDAMFARFAAPSEAAPALEARVLASPAGASRLLLGTTDLALASEPLTDFHAYTVIFGEVLRRLEGVFFAHGAVVSGPRRTVVLAGPSGRGKTTLALALMRRGFRLMSDDFAPLRRADGMLVPFLKRVGICGRGEAAPPSGIARDGAGWTRFGDKWLVDPADLPGAVEETPRRPTHLLLLGAPPDLDADVTYRVATAGDAAGLERDLAGLPGLTVARAASPSGRSYLRVEVRGGARGGFHQRCHAEGSNLLLFEPLLPPPSFAGAPAIEAVPRLAAATSLLGEILNRVPGSRLLDGSGGKPAVLLVELAGQLASVTCARLAPGAPDATAAAIDHWSGAERS